MTNLVAIQLAIKNGLPSENLNHIRSLFESSKIGEGDIVCLPELINTGYDWTCIDNLNENDCQAFIKELSALACTKQVWLIAGSVADIRGDSRFNVSYSFAPDGTLLGEYRKVHLFTPIGEEHHFRSGSSQTTVRCGNMTAGVGICYDLRFPEFFRSLTLNGSSVIALPSAWPSIRKDVWRTLVMARAMENQCYFIGCNRAGSDVDGVEYGNSLIVDPFGIVIAESHGSSEDILVANFNIETLNKSRRLIPSLSERRPDVYRLDFAIAQDILVNEFNAL
jgi:omega-amidase